MTKSNTVDLSLSFRVIQSAEELKNVLSTVKPSDEVLIAARTIDSLSFMPRVYVLIGNPESDLNSRARYVFPLELGDSLTDEDRQEVVVGMTALTEAVVPPKDRVESIARHITSEHAAAAKNPERLESWNNPLNKSGIRHVGSIDISSAIERLESCVVPISEVKIPPA